ncbi:MAG: DUF411 domain-containing protein [Burkholderiaceae bacterium]|nr:DUF411 domain-containing protein [Burkholderiaceae bacterium]
MKKRSFLKILPVFVAGAQLVLNGGTFAKTRPIVEIWKDLECGCCKDWVKPLEGSGLDVRVHDSGNSSARARLGIPVKLGSCHTAQVGDYAVEGHVPARDIQRLLAERPKAIGLAVPGMPVGSPGMDGSIYGKRKDAYDVLLVKADGSTSIFKSYFSKSSTIS